MADKVTIEYPEAGKRIREVVSRSNYRATGKYPSIKTGKTHRWESFIELDAFRRLDADTAVMSFIEQPARIRYPDHDGKIRVHYPDLLIHFPGQKQFVEVKSDREATSEEIRKRTELLRILLADQGFGYRVWTESEIRPKNRIRNIRHLLRYGRKPVPLDRFEVIRRKFAAEERMAWGELTQAHNMPYALADACRLTLEGRMSVDLDEYLDENSEVTFPNRKAS
jgi:hypothetical protein